MKDYKHCKEYVDYLQNAYVKMSTAKQAVTYRLVKAEKLIKTHHSEYGFNTACFITAGGMVMCAYLLPVNLPQTFKGTLTIPLVSVSFFERWRCKT